MPVVVSRFTALQTLINRLSLGCVFVWAFEIGDGSVQGYPGPGHTGAGNGELEGLNRPSMSKLIGGEPHTAQSRMADTLHQVLMLHAAEFKSAGQCHHPLYSWRWQYSLLAAGTFG